MPHVVIMNDPQGRFAELSRTARNLDAAADAKRRTAQAQAAKSKAAKVAADRAAEQRAHMNRQLDRQYAEAAAKARADAAIVAKRQAAEKRKTDIAGMWDRVLAARTRA